MQPPLPRSSKEQPLLATDVSRTSTFRSAVEVRKEWPLLRTSCFLTASIAACLYAYGMVDTGAVRGPLGAVANLTTALEADGCSKAPVGSCLLFGCIAGRNSECIGHKCMCRPNFCARHLGFFRGGVCELPPSLWKADVARVDAGHPGFPSPHDSVDTAVCLSGGGARAASLTLGVFRALEALELMQHVDAVSSISGSLFASIPYMFANMSMYRRQGPNLHSEPPWGYTTDPERLSLHVLDYDTSPIGTSFADGWGGTWGTVKSFVKTFLPHVATDRHHVEAEWRNLMRKQFLEPFSLGNKDCLMARDDAAESRIKAANPQLANFCFHKPVAGKPKVFVIGASILAPVGHPQTDAASFQISPDYSGSPFLVNISHRPLYAAATDSQGLGDAVIGGGLVETFGFGGVAPTPESGGTTPLPSPHRPFSLADAMAIATYADFLPGSSIEWTPSYHYWPIGRGSEEARRLMIGDGGFIEDTGLLPMLQRRARRIALFLFVGPGQTISDAVDYCSLEAEIEAGTFDPATFEPAGKIADSLYTVFGYGYDDGKWHKSHNAVFRREEMFSVACGLQTLKRQGKPQVYRRSHDVQPNPYWGIRAYRVQIVYAYNDRIPKFEELLPLDTQHALKHDMKGFPTNLPAGLFMKPRIIQLMAAQSEYSILQNAALFKAVLTRGVAS